MSNTNYAHDIDGSVIDNSKANHDWISVDDRLPDIIDGQYSERILIYGNRYGIVERHTGVYTELGRFMSYGEQITATHWMPLPKSPEVRNER